MRKNEVKICIEFYDTKLKLAIKFDTFKQKQNIFYYIDNEENRAILQ